MIAIEIIFHTVYSKNTGIYSGFCMCHKLKDEDEDTYVIHPLLQVGPGRGGDHIYIYIYFFLVSGVMSQFQPSDLMDVAKSLPGHEVWTSNCFYFGHWLEITAI